jgi:hypothetical protein
MESHIDTRRRLVDVASSQADQPDGKITQADLVDSEGRTTLDAVPTIHPHPRRAIDENIGDRVIGDQRGQLTKVRDLACVPWRLDRLAWSRVDEKGARPSGRETVRIMALGIAALRIGWEN